MKFSFGQTSIGEQLTISEKRFRRTGRLWVLAILLSGLAWGSPLIAPAHAVVVPAARSIAGFATDPATGKLVMFGGIHQGQVRGDTWLWNGSAWNQPALGAAPSPRYSHSMASDPSTGTVVLFGGRSVQFGGLQALKSDTWLWDGTAKRWTQQFPAMSPSAREGSSMAYDKTTKTVVLFGGGGLPANTDVPGDTWLWDGSAKTWTRQLPLSSPPHRLSPNLVYDARAENVMLFGGARCEDGCGVRGDTWTWNGRSKNWAQQSPATSPSARAGAYSTYHAASGNVVLFGGGDGEDLKDTWIWSGVTASWSLVTPTARPCARSSGSMAYHPSTATAVIFGGTGPPNSACPGVIEPDTWAWNGTNWNRRA